MLVELFLPPGPDERAEGIHNGKISVYAACADLDDLVRHAVIGRVAALIPFQVKYDDIAGLRAG